MKNKYYKINICNKYLSKDISYILLRKNNKFGRTYIYATEVEEGKMKDFLSNTFYEKYNGQDDDKLYYNEKSEVEDEEVKRKKEIIELNGFKRTYKNEIINISKNIKEEHIKYDENQKKNDEIKREINQTIKNLLKNTSYDKPENYKIYNLFLSNSESIIGMQIPVLAIKISEDKMLELYTKKTIEYEDNSESNLTYSDYVELKTNELYAYTKYINNNYEKYIKNINNSEQMNIMEKKKQESEREVDLVFNEIMSTQKLKKKSFLKSIVDSLK